MNSTKYLLLTLVFTAISITVFSQTTAPSNLTAVAISNSVINLSWKDNSNDENGFQIERSLTPLTGFTKVGTTAANIVSYSCTGLLAGTKYYFRIRPTNAIGGTGFSSETLGTTLIDIPTAPNFLSATAVTTTQINLTWNDNSNNETGFRIERSLTAGSGYTEIIVTPSNGVSYSCTGLIPGTKYFFRIRSTNTAGNSNYTTEAFTTTISDVPAAPTALTLVVESPNQINLSWTDNSTNETGFLIERSLINGTGYLQIGTTQANITSYSNIGLKAGTKYYYRIRATNSGGNSSFTPESSATTSVTLPLTPSNLTATAVSANQVNLRWIDISTNETSFIIESSMTPLTGFTLLANVPPNNVSFSSTGLMAGTKYFFRVRSVNAAGNSPDTPEVFAITMANPPSNVTATAVSSTQINLTWVDNSNNEVAFLIERSSMPGSGYIQIASTGANATSYNCTGLSSATRYYFRIKSTNPVATSVYTADIVATTNTDPPIAPSALTAVATSSSQINLTWMGSSNNETGFLIERSITSTTGFMQIGSTTANVVTYNNMGLTPGTKYFYRVRATNTGGNSAYTTEAVATTSMLPPNAPSTLSAATASTNQINITWSDNSNNETGFVIERSTTLGAGYTQIASVAVNIVSYNCAGLMPDTKYFFRVKSINTIGSSTYSTEAFAQTNTNPPTVPGILTAIAASPAQINLTWTESSNNETGFLIEQSFTSGTGYVQIANTAPNVVTYSVMNLKPGIKYFFRIRSTNAGGYSAYTKEASTITLINPPTAPTVFNAVAVSSNQINLTWVDNSNNETGFQVERSLTPGSGFVQIASVSANMTALSITDLTAETKYYFRIKAINAVGSSDYSKEGLAITSPNPTSAAVNP